MCEGRLGGRASINHPPTFFCIFQIGGVGEAGRDPKTLNHPLFFFCPFFFKLEG
jgi:hypothetical protein